MKYYVGIDLGGTNIAAGVVNENLEIISRFSLKTFRQREIQEIVKDMVRTAVEAVKRAKIQMNDVEWVGVGIPGTIKAQDGVIEYSNNLDWYNIPIVEMLEKSLNKKIYIANDANAAAYGEYLAGSAKEADISVMITLGTGVGGGIVIDNKIYTGFNEAGAELGHNVIVMDGRNCTCGRKGCLEAYASATGLVETTKEYMLKDKTSEMWKIVDGDINRVNGRTAFDGLRAGDETSKKVVDIYVKQLACGITNVINTFQPDILCIGGGISHEKDNLIKPLREIVKKEVYSRNSNKNTKIVVAELGNDAGIIGAAMLGQSK